MEALINYFLRFGQLNTQQIDLVKRSAMEMQLKKPIILEAGKTAKGYRFIQIL